MRKIERAEIATAAVGCTVNVGIGVVVRVHIHYYSCHVAFDVIQWLERAACRMPAENVAYARIFFRSAIPYFAVFLA